MRPAKFLLLCLLSSPLFAQKKGKPTTQPPATVRQQWLMHMQKVVRPVLYNLANDSLKINMPVETAPNIDNRNHRTRVSYLEAFGRTMSGIAPWLQSEAGDANEKALRAQYRAWTLKALANAVDSSTNDYMLWDGGQPLVDASFLALGLVRCPWIWENTDELTRKRTVEVFVRTRNTVPVYSNWILFQAMIETFFLKYGYPYDKVRIEFGVREFAQHWYTGDGMFSDGMNFALDYYNSYVIQPYLTAILEVTGKSYNWFVPKFDKISKRYAEIQERLINADGSFPAIGRSIVYRGGAFQHLADMAARKRLPPGLKPAQVRGALTAVITRTLGAPKTFNEKGWLTLGLYGEQPGLADFYITTGSLYLCATIFLPLGLPETDPFWADPDTPWSSAAIWSGQDAKVDHALDLK
ncbi:DUF2264 domain-containing protein [Parasegetibacter sp. NRK P23]|uniref:DUF2264 domain-containing protein n=1 Tax=Parasegetibacter sp. NRK P23 TaxID=2942999 RepID=UPI002042EBFE|nr:DUF2264 domain-containing protein [Parasegetibacter sp. NRK P23]MCM5530142.1 DUF2264 domain-containing protein [Parasegetibacter sp. NRK P23]